MTNKVLQTSPLSKADIELIESTNLSSIDKHHLRILAHCLECFKVMGNESTSFLPKEKQRLDWFVSQPALENQTAFISVLYEQFAVAADQLESMAADLNIGPLELTLQHLIDAKLKTKYNHR